MHKTCDSVQNIEWYDKLGKYRILSDEWGLVGGEQVGAGQVISTSCSHESLPGIPVAERMNNQSLFCSIRVWGVLGGAPQNCHLSCCPRGAARTLVICKE